MLIISKLKILVIIFMFIWCLEASYISLFTHSLPFCSALILFYSSYFFQFFFLLFTTLYLLILFAHFSGHKFLVGSNILLLRVFTRKTGKQGNSFCSIYFVWKKQGQWGEGTRNEELLLTFANKPLYLLPLKLFVIPTNMHCSIKIGGPWWECDGARLDAPREDWHQIISNANFNSHPMPFNLFN